MKLKSMDRKGQIDKKINAVVIIIISIVVLFQIFAGIVPEAQSAGDTMSDDTICVNAGCIVNTSLTPDCQSNRSPQGFGGNSSGACGVALQNIPLASLFGSSGLIILILMAFLFIGALKIVLPSSKK